MTRQTTRQARRLQPFIARNAADTTTITTEAMDLGGTISSYMMVSALRGLWPFASFNGSEFVDYSFQARNLSASGAMAYAAADIIPYASFNGSSYLYRNDEAGLDITTNLSFGGWFYVTSFSAPTAANTAMGKSSNAAPNLGYLLDFVTTAGPETHTRFLVSSNGTATVTVSNTARVYAGRWYFLAARFTPSTEIALWTNAEKVTNTTAIPASIVNNAQPLSIGVCGAGVANWLTGKAALCWLSAAAVSDTYITHLYERSRRHFE